VILAIALFLIAAVCLICTAFLTSQVGVSREPLTPTAVSVTVLINILIVCVLILAAVKLWST
jgi:hypothetical protein